MGRSRGGLTSKIHAVVDAAGLPVQGSLSPEIKTALEQGTADAWAEFEVLQKEKIDTGQVTSGDLFGTRKYLKNNYLYRMAGAVFGIGGLSKEEAMYPVYRFVPQDWPEKHRARLGPHREAAHTAFARLIEET